MGKKIKIVELATELNMDPKELFKRIKEEGFLVKTLASSVTEEEAIRIKKLFEKKQELIIIKKEVQKEERPSVEVFQKDHFEEMTISGLSELASEPSEVPKKKKIIFKKKKSEVEEKQNESGQVKLSTDKTVTQEAGLIQKELEELRPADFLGKEQTLEEAKELSSSLPEEPLIKEERLDKTPEKRVVTDFKPRKERFFKSREAKDKEYKEAREDVKLKTLVIPTEERQAVEEPKFKREEIKKKKRGFDLEVIEEKRKPKKKFGAPRKEKEELEDLFLEEEPTGLFEEKEEVEIFKPRERKEKIERVSERPPTLPPKERKIKIYETIQVSELAKLMGVKVGELIKKSLQMGMPVTANQSIDVDTAAILADEFGYQVEKAPIEEEILLQYTPPSPDELKPRPPVVTVMGHVDHGKTTLLDAIRKTDVASREAGGITQHIGAYTVKLEDGRMVTFIDTPGHEAFTSMRARGAQVTDIVILVVAADDGVMEQTIEAIEHARAAKVPIVVAINKIDKPEANPERVKSQLAELGLIPEEWGGDTLMVNISARNKIGINDLLELVLLQAEMLELKAAYDRPARGRIIESQLDKGRGPVATVLVQEGTLKEGDIFVAGFTYGRVRAMFDSYGKRVKSATPSIPVEVIGFEELPQAGDDFIVIGDEEKARKIAEYRQRKAREAEVAKEVKISLEKIFEKLKEGELKELNIVLKADTQGTLEALQASLKKLSTEKVKINIIRAGIGAISESDIMLASASEAIVIGFNVKPTSQARDLTKREGVDVRFYDVIYQVLDDVKKAMAGLLEPKIVEEIKGVAEVRATFKIPKVGVVAGCYVKEGVVGRNHNIRVIRDGMVIYTGKIASLKRFKEDVKEVMAGYECGLKIEGFNDIKEGDILETFEIKKMAQDL